MPSNEVTLLDSGTIVGTFSTIEDAVAAASNDDTIEATAGEYDESVLIGSPSGALTSLNWTIAPLDTVSLNSNASPSSPSNFPLTVTYGATLTLDGGGTLEDMGGAIYAGKTLDGVATSGVINLEGATSLDLDANGAYTNLQVGQGEETAGTQGYFNQSDTSTVTIGTNLTIGVDGGIGVYTLTDDAILTTGSADAFVYLGLNQETGAFNSATSGTLNVEDNATFDLSKGWLYLGDTFDNTTFPSGSGKIVQSGTSTVNLGGYGAFVGANQGGAGEYDLQGGTLTVSGSSVGLVIGADAGANGIVDQSGGLLIIDTTLTIGESGTGVYDLDGGVLEVGGGGLSGTGAFDLGGGEIEVTGSQLVTDVDVALTAGKTSTLDLGALGADFTGSVTGSGNLIVKGSTVTGVAEFANLSTTGELDLEGATLDTGATAATVGDLTGSGTIELANNGYLTVGGDGASTTFTGTIEGVNLNDDGLNVAGTGTLTLNDVDATAASIYVSGGTLANTGTNAFDYLAVGEGTGHTATATVGVGDTLTINDTYKAALQVGDFGGTGTFDQTGGAVTVNGSFNVGNQGGAGTYALSGGTLELGSAEGAGNTSALGALDVIGRNTGTHAASSGEIDISGTGVLQVDATTELILGDNTAVAGSEGHGLIDQTGGTLDVEAGGSLYLSAYGAGEYDLDGGVLEVGGTGSLFSNYNSGSETGTFSLGGGEIEVTGSQLVTDVNAALTAGKTSTLDVGALDADFTGSVTGSGNLIVKGSTVTGVAEFANLSTTGELDLEGATLDTGATAATVGDLAGSGTIELANNGSLTVGGDGASTAFTGAIEGVNLNDDGLNVAGTGTLTLNDVDATAASIYVSGGTLANTGTNAFDYLAVGEGTGHTATATVGVGDTLTINDTYKAALQVGDFGGTGTFDQTGGAVTVNGSFNVGNQGGAGTYALSGGTLELDSAEGVGNTSALGALDVIGRNTGTHAASSGEIDISGTGVLQVDATTELILGDNTAVAGSEGHGLIDQTGGTLDVEAGGSLYLSAYGAGEYDLDGGVLEIGGTGSLFSNYNSGSETGTFSLGGGEIEVTGSQLATDVDVTLAAGKTSTLDVGTLGADFTGSVTGAGKLIVSGSTVTGVAEFANLSTTGELDLEGATLDTGATAATVGDLAGSGTIELANNGYLTVGGDGASTTFTGTIEGVNLNDDGLNVAGTGTLTLNDVVSTAASIYVSGGTLANTGTNAFDYLAVGEGTGHTATATVGVGDTLTINDTYKAALQVGDFGGTGTFDQTGGAVTVNGSFNVGNQGGAGTYALSGGTLELGSAEGAGNTSALGALDVIGRNTGTHAASSGEIDISGTGVLQVDATTELILGDNTAVAGSEGHGLIDQTGGTLDVEAGGSLYLSAYGAGEYDLDGGVLEIGGTGSLFSNYNSGSETGTFSLGGGEIEVTGSQLATDVDVTLAAGKTSTLDVGTLGADFTGSVTGAGKLIVSGSTITGVAEFANLSTTGELDLEGATLDTGATAATVGDLAGSGTIELANNGYLTVGGDGASTTFTGTIEGVNLNDDGLNVAGTGTLTLNDVVSTAASIYVSGGTLANTGTNAFDYLAVGEGTGHTATATVGVGDTLTINDTYKAALQVGDFGGTGTFDQTGGAVTVNGSFNVGNQGGAGTYALSGGTLELGSAEGAGNTSALGALDVIGRNTGTHAASSGEIDISGTGVLQVDATTELILGDNTAVAGSEGHGLIDQTGGTLDVEAGGSLYLSAYGAGEYDLDGGVLEVGGTGSLFSNYNSGSETGTFSLGGGEIEVTGSQLVTDVNAALTAGKTSTLDVGALDADFTGSVTGSGNLIVKGSTVTGVAEFANLSTTGELDLEGATLDTGATAATVGDLAGSGTIELANNGSLTVGGDGASTAFTGAIEGVNLNDDGLNVAGTGTLTLNDVDATAASIYVSGGTLANTGTNAFDYLAVGEGTGHTATATVGVGDTLTINDTYKAALQVGDFGGTGTFDQTGGAVTVNGSFNVGNQGGAGTYALSGGTLELGSAEGAGNTSALGALDVIGRNTGTHAASSGEIDISGTGVLQVDATTELILGDNTAVAGSEGHGLIDQTGGTLDVEAGGSLYLSAYGAGEYDLDGGVLEVGGTGSLFSNYNSGSETGTFSLGGGEIEVTGSQLVTDVNAALTAGKTSTLDVGALDADFTGSVTGSGNLIVKGSTVTGVAEFANLSTTGELDLEGATLDTGATAATVGDLAGSGTIELANNGSLTVGGDGASTAFTGAIEGVNLNDDGLNVAGTGTLTLNDVDATAASIYVSGGTLANTGTNAFDYLAVGEGTGHTATATVGVGDTLTINDTYKAALQVGDFGGTGTFDQTGGAVTVNGSFNVGNQGGAGTYALSGGTLELDSAEGVGNTSALGALDVIGRNTGTHAASSGEIDISGTGVLQVDATTELILGDNTAVAGSEGHGLIDQTGGTLDVEAGGSLYLSAYGAGEYDLDGGVLEVGGTGSLFSNYNSGSETGTFSLGGGEIEVTGSQLVTDVNVALTAGKTSTLDVGALGADFTGSVTGSGKLIVTGSGVAKLTNDNLFSGGVTLEGGTLELGTAQSAGSGAITFAANVDPTLAIDGTTMPINTINGFASTDAIDLTSIENVIGGQAEMDTTDNVLTITEGANAYTLNFDPTQDFSNEEFHVASDNSGAGPGTLITMESAPCYCRGSRILTEGGEVAVEDLNVGELVVTASGALRPIVWIGHRQIDIRKHPAPESVRPVCVRSGALGQSLPHRDLWLSPGHCIESEGVLMPISTLINGFSVAQMKQTSVEYWHVELDKHDIIIAEGLPAESYLDSGNRTGFVNGGAFIEAHPNFQSKHWAATCLPMTLAGPPVVRTKARLLARLLEEGYFVSQDAKPNIMVDGLQVDPIRLSQNRLAFELPADGRDILLRSDVFIPRHSAAESYDSRELGLCVRSLQIDGEGVALDNDKAYEAGWQRAEIANGSFSHRWTNGAARLPAGARLVIVDLAGWGTYWRKLEGVLAASLIDAQVRNCSAARPPRAEAFDQSKEADDVGVTGDDPQDHPQPSERVQVRA